jgi:hypothetical protein
MAFVVSFEGYIFHKVTYPVDVENTSLVLHTLTVAEITCMSVLVSMDSRSSLA